MKDYLKPTEIVDWHHPDVLSKAKELSYGDSHPDAIARSCFEWVRDEIKHIDDYNIQYIVRLQE